MDKDLKAEMYRMFLDKEGFRPELDSDGDVRFKMEGLTYFVEVDARDDAYFRVCLPNIWTIENDQERARVLIACDYANAKSKVAKVFTVRDRVWGSLEIFVPDPEVFRDLFMRCMSALKNVAWNFAEKMKEENA